MSIDRLTRLRQRLSQHDLGDVASACERISPEAPGISRNNIRAIRDGRTQNPGVLTLDAIEAAMDAIEKPQEVASS